MRGAYIPPPMHLYDVVRTGKLDVLIFTSTRSLDLVSSKGKYSKSL
jgi:hypothetical protein